MSSLIFDPKTSALLVMDFQTSVVEMAGTDRPSPSCHPARAGRHSRIERGPWRCARGRAAADRGQDRRSSVGGIGGWADSGRPPPWVERRERRALQAARRSYR